MLPLWIALLGGALVVTFWPQILHFVKETVVPFLQDYFPMLADIVDEAFTILDTYISPLAAMVKRAWNKVRGILLKAVVEINKRTSSVWVKKATSWLIDKLETRTLKKVVTEEEVPWEELPQDLREEYLRTGQVERNVTKIRDEELGEVPV